MSSLDFDGLEKSVSFDIDNNLNSCNVLKHTLVFSVYLLELYLINVLRLFSGN